LHSGNFLVDRKGSAHVIDFGSIGSQWHAWRDLTKVVRDIYLELFRPAQDRQNAVEELWKTVGVVSVPGAPCPDPELEKARSALQTLEEFAAAGIPPDVDWAREYQVALLAVFMFAASDDRRLAGQRRAALYVATQLRTSLEHAGTHLRLPDPVTLAAQRKEAV